MKKIMIVLVAGLSLAAIGCKKKGGAGEAMAKMGEFKDKMCACKDTACAQKVSDEMTKWSQDMAKDQKEPQKMSEEDTKKATEVSKQMSDCMQKAMGAPAMGGGGGGETPGSAATPPAAGSGEMAPAGGGATGTLPKECDDYKDAIAKLANCDKMPQQARDALKQAYDQASAGWSNLPAEAKAGLATACKAGADAVMQSGKAACGW